MKGNIHSIETLGLHDGPGVRSVIFFQGCQLRCKYCHNPDTWSFAKQNEYSVEELVKQVKDFRNYYDASGGGVTLSGGEVLMQPDFALALCKALKEEKIHVALDTSGIGIGKYDEILKYVDLVLLDLKHYNKNKFKALTGQSIDELYKFIHALNDSSAKVWIRNVIVEGTNDTYDDIKGLSEIAKGINNIELVELLPFKKMCIEKYRQMQVKFPYEEKEETNEKKVAFLNEQINRLINIE